MTSAGRAARRGRIRKRQKIKAFDLYYSSVATVPGAHRGEVEWLSGLQNPHGHPSSGPGGAMVGGLGSARPAGLARPARPGLSLRRPADSRVDPPIRSLSSHRLADLIDLTGRPCTSRALRPDRRSDGAGRLAGALAHPDRAAALMPAVPEALRQA
jgi:hypothetical protein